MARPKTNHYYDDKRRIVVGYFHMQKGRRAVKRDLFTYDEIDYKNRNGKKIERTKEEKAKYFADVYNEKQLELWEKYSKSEESIDKQTISLKKLSEKWLEEIKTNSTKQSYSITTRYYFNCVGDYFIEDHEREYIERFKQNLIEKKHSEATINKHLRVIRAFFNWLKYNEYTNKNLRFKIKTTPNVDISIFTQKELEDIESKIKENIVRANTTYRRMMAVNDYRAFKLIKYTGLRRGETLYLKLNNICIDERIIKVRENLEYKWKPKKNKIRDIPIAENLYNYLVEDIKQRDEIEKYYLDNGKGQPYLKTLDRMTNRFKEICIQVGIDTTDRRIKPLHGIRATLLTQLDTKGLSTFQIQKIAGHSDMSTTQRYVNKDTEIQLEILNRIT
jgi:integrase/recombinase XerD